VPPLLHWQNVCYAMLLHGSCAAFRPVYCTEGCSLCSKKKYNVCTKMSKVSCCGRCFNIALNIRRKDDKAFKKFLLKYFQTNNSSNPVARRPLPIATISESSTSHRNRQRRQPSVARHSRSRTQGQPASTASITATKK